MMLWHTAASGLSAQISSLDSTSFLCDFASELGYFLVDTFIGEIQQMLNSTKVRQLHYDHDLSAMV
jgi:hypothetical protein